MDDRVIVVVGQVVALVDYLSPVIFGVGDRGYIKQSVLLSDREHFILS